MKALGRSLLHHVGRSLSSATSIWSACAVVRQPMESPRIKMAGKKDGRHYVAPPAEQGLITNVIADSLK